MDDFDDPAPPPTLTAPRHPGAGVRTYAVPVALLGLVGLGLGMLIYATTPRGPGVETDAVNYLSAAGSLSQGAGYLGWDGQLLPYFPPGYPLAVALLRMLTGFGVEQAAQGVDIAMFAGLVLATYALACRVIDNPAIRLVATAAVASSPVVLGIYALVSSETLFNFLCVIALVAVCLVSDSPRNTVRHRVAFGLLAVVAAVAVLTRLAGVALVLSLAITVVVLESPTERFIVRAGRGLGFSTLVLAPIAAWDVFLHSQTGTWSFGDRPPATVGWTGNVVTAAQTLAGWVPAPSAIFPRWGWLNLAAAAAVLVALATALGGLFKGPAKRPRSVAPVLIFCLAYPVVMIVLSSTVDLAGALDNRYLSPVLAPLVVLVGFGIETTWSNARRQGWPGRGLAAAMVGAVSLSLASTLVQSTHTAQQGHVEGISGATTATWSNMGVLRAARSLPTKDGEILLSNLPEMMTYSTRSLYQYPPGRADGVPEELRQRVNTRAPAYLVVLSVFDDPSLYTPNQLAQWFTVRTLYSGPDGQLVELTSRGGVAG